MTGGAPWDDLFDAAPAAGAPPRPGPRVYSVFELNTAAAAALRGSLGEVWVEGEISNLRDAGSGHLYFTLKDEQAAIDAVMFRSSRARLAFEPENGRRVTARGEPTLYEPRGKFQIVLREMKLAGLGALFEAFERMKKELAAAGWFDRRRPIPMLPRRIGVVTSPHGAALRDILHVLGRRCPSVPVLLAPCRVQGEGAAAEVAAAIARLNQPGAGRGGHPRRPRRRQHRGVVGLQRTHRRRRRARVARAGDFGRRP
jgi:exodeoxyribonuclease VII large subunit